ncbi:hypothetical protein G3I59_33425 [Amycolatopsis rubida]|uniref:Uncharacterized protein n=1 Tax=Amycolatopsis rubida TaxID=112413 RepID=A0ABX0BY96_9PSEU|nr:MULTISPECIES: hypothetical protein [Amycolatopsis]MYW95372.1 hypothetical protein [Amycolatopsis rubida]NEC60361.1 hypothetical protein [Amycolatopsis rubida]OAP28223.1 hypothetical protein A4R44_00009 [Amycolatopsis sp. M39]
MLDGDTTQWDHGQEIPRVLRAMVRPRGYLTLLDCPPEHARELRRTGQPRLGEPDSRGRVTVEICGVATPGSYTTCLSGSSRCGGCAGGPPSPRPPRCSRAAIALGGVLISRRLRVAGADPRAALGRVRGGVEDLAGRARFARPDRQV